MHSPHDLYRSVDRLLTRGRKGVQPKGVFVNDAVRGPGNKTRWRFIATALVGVLAVLTLAFWWMTVAVSTEYEPLGQALYIVGSRPRSVAKDFRSTDGRHAMLDGRGALPNESEMSRLRHHLNGAAT